MKCSIMMIVMVVLMLSSASFGYSGGNGTAEDPYQIATKADLLALAGTTTDYNKCFILTADIDMEGQVFTTAIIAAGISAAFTGTSDGNGHKITNFTINGGSNSLLGLFGYISSGGSVKNLGLENFAVSGYEHVGGLVGWIFGGNINNCYSTGVVNGTYEVGGLIGLNYYSWITNCYSTGTVTGGDESEELGGLVGENYYGIISNCYSTGTVAGGNGSWNLGGLVGDNEGYISNCYSTGTVTGGDDNSSEHGGLVGINWGIISNCFSTGAVSGGYLSGALGGLVGWNTGGGSISNCFSTGTVTGGVNSVYLGGLVGYNYQGSIGNCFSTGIVTNGSNSYHLGGLAGDNNDIISSCYFLITSGPDNGYGTPLTDAQMKQKSSFVGWDFDAVWDIIEGQAYPYLRENKMVRPVDGWLTQRFDFNEDVGYEGHEGIDIDSGIDGKEVVVAANGMVVCVHRSITSGAGLWVWIWHGVVPDLTGNLQVDISTRYLHLKDIPNEIQPGTEVVKGRTVIGKASNTGDGLFPPHLHFEVRQGGNPGDIMSGEITYYDTQALNPLRFVGYEDRSKKPGSLVVSAHSPVDLIVEDPDGLVISKNVSEIPTASYFEIPLDEEGNPGYELIIIDDRKQGEYLIEVVPEPNALPTDTYSLMSEVEGRTAILAEDVQIEAIPPEPYEFESKLCYSDFDADGDVDWTDLATLCLRWLEQDCNYPAWCEGTDVDYSGNVNFVDFAIFAKNWLEGTAP